MGKLMQEVFEEFEALELAKEVEKAKEDMTKNLNVNAVTRLVAEQYKKAHSLCDQTKENESMKLLNKIIPPGTDIDNDQIYIEENGQVLRDL